MTAAGTNVAGAFKAQDDRFRGMRIAHDTVTSGFDSFRAGMRINGDRQIAAVESWTTGAIRGTAPFSTPGGPNTMLPYYSPAGQVINSGGNHYVQNGQGTYYQWTGNGWTPMSAH